MIKFISQFRIYRSIYYKLYRSEPSTMLLYKLVSSKNKNAFLIRSSFNLVFDCRIRPLTETSE